VNEQSRMISCMYGSIRVALQSHHRWQCPAKRAVFAAENDGSCHPALKMAVCPADYIHEKTVNSEWTNAIIIWNDGMKEEFNLPNTQHYSFHKRCFGTDQIQTTLYWREEQAEEGKLLSSSRDLSVRCYGIGHRYSWTSSLADAGQELTVCRERLLFVVYPWTKADMPRMFKRSQRPLRAFHSLHRLPQSASDESSFFISKFSQFPPHARMGLIPAKANITGHGRRTGYTVTIRSHMGNHIMSHATHTLFIATLQLRDGNPEILDLGFL